MLSVVIEKLRKLIKEIDGRWGSYLVTTNTLIIFIVNSPNDTLPVRVGQ